MQACWQTSRYQDCLQHGAPRACRTTNSSPKTLTLNPTLNACSATHPRHVAALAAAVPAVWKMPSPVVVFLPNRKGRPKPRKVSFVTYAHAST